MKASEVLIAWEPKHGRGEDRPNAGEIKSGVLLREHDEDWTKPYLNTGGAAFLEWRTLTGSDLLVKILADFHSIVVGDGVDPKAAHEAFLLIDEYRGIIAPDLPGADRE